MSVFLTVIAMGGGLAGLAALADAIVDMRFQAWIAESDYRESING